MMEIGESPGTRRGRYQRLVELVGGHRRALGVRVRLSLATFLNRRFGRPFPAVVYVPVKGMAEPIAIRAGTSDIPLFGEIFIGQEFGWIESLTGINTILDCGANVGYVSSVLLTRFPEARVVAVEPDPSNAAMYRKNTAAFGDRATLVVAGVWPRTAGLKIVRFGPGADWGIQVRECEPGETPDVHAKSIGDLMREHGLERINLLKLDIEGSEKHLFDGDIRWLDRVDHLSIELHGDDCGVAFEQAMTAYDYTRSRSGALIVCTNIRRKVAV